jgi:hypothetical protein
MRIRWDFDEFAMSEGDGCGISSGGSCFLGSDGGGVGGGFDMRIGSECGKHRNGAAPSG